MNAVEATNLVKSFGRTQALKSISFSVGEGELFGFIGPDGSGKTTLFRILATLLIPGEGSVSVLGKDPVKQFADLRKEIGYMPGRFSLYQDLTVEENLKFFASIFNTTIEENYDLVRDIYSQIEPFKKRRAGKLSGGMKQKLALSCALIHKPKLLLLDEPTTGVDAVSRKEFWEMLKRLKEQGITIIVSTPYMDEASLCERIALIQNGTLLNVDTPDNIIKKYRHRLVSVWAENKYALINTLRQYPFTQSVFSFGDSLHYTDKREDFHIDEIRNYLVSKGIEHPLLNEIKPSIEDSFMELMEKPDE